MRRTLSILALVLLTFTADAAQYNSPYGSSNNAITFLRSSTKVNFQTGTDAASNTPSLETVVAVTPRTSAIVTDHADGGTEALGAGITGKIWGRCQAVSGAVYLLAPGGAWQKVKTFAGEAIWAIYTSKKGYVFVATGAGKIYRSVLADGTDDWTTVLTFPAATINGRQWSFADKGDGVTLWISEYGGSLLADDNAAQRIYKSTDSGANWTQIFKFSTDFPSDFHAGIHIHKIVYNKYNDTLYMAHGDTDPNYIYKSVGGVAGNWQRIDFRYLQYGTTYIYMQPTSAIVRSDGNILWFDDAGRSGVWLHNTSNDTFTYINAGNAPNGFYFDAKLIDGVIYAPTESADASRNILSVLDPMFPYQTSWIDLVNSGAVGQGWEYVAGKGSDGYIYFQYKNGATLGTKKYKAVTLTRATGISVDPAITNLQGDPFSNIGSGGWTSYANQTTPGGFYGSYFMAAKSTDTNRFTINRVDPISVTIYAKQYGLPTAATSIRIYPKWYNGVTQLSTGAPNEFLASRVPDDYYRKFSYTINPAASNATTDSMKLHFVPASAGNFRIGAISVLQGTSRPQLIQLSRAAESSSTTIGTAIPSTATIIGSAASRDHFDTTGTYTLWSVKNAGGTKWMAVVANNGQLKLIDDTHAVGAPVITTVTGLPTQTLNVVDGDPPQDTYSWAVTLGGGNASLYLASQRSDVESVSAAYTHSNDLTVHYDGSGVSSGTEWGGMVLWRALYNAILSTANMTQFWSSGYVTANQPDSGLMSVVSGETVSHDSYVFGKGKLSSGRGMSTVTRP